MKKGLVFVFSIFMVSFLGIMNINFLGISNNLRKNELERNISSDAFETTYLSYDYENNNPPEWSFRSDSIADYVSASFVFVYDIDTAGNWQSGDMILQNNSQYKSIYFMATTSLGSFLNTEIKTDDWYNFSWFGEINWDQDDLNLGLGIGYRLPGSGIGTSMYFLDPSDTLNGDNFNFVQTLNQLIPSAVYDLNITNVTYSGFDINFDYFKNDGEGIVKVMVGNEIVYNDMPIDGTNTISYSSALSNQNYTVDVYLNDNLVLSQNVLSKNKPIMIDMFRINNLKDNYDFEQTTNEANGVAEAILEIENEDNQVIEAINFFLLNQDKELISTTNLINEISNNEYLFTFSDLTDGNYWAEATINYLNNDGTRNAISTSMVSFSINKVVVNDPSIDLFNIIVEQPSAPTWNNGTINLNYDLEYDDEKITIESSDYALYKNGIEDEGANISVDSINKAITISNLEEDSYYLKIDLHFKYLGVSETYTINYQSIEFVLENQQIRTPIIIDSALEVTNVAPNGLVLGAIKGEMTLSDASDILNDKIKIELYEDEILQETIEKDIIGSTIVLEEGFSDLQVGSYKIRILGTFNTGISVNEEREIGIVQNIMVEQDLFRIPRVSLAAGANDENRLWFQIKSLETEDNFWLDVKEIKIEGNLIFKNLGEQTFNIHLNLETFDLQTLQATNTEAINGFLNNIMFINVDALSVKGINTDWEKISSFTINNNSEIVIKEVGVNIEPSSPLITKKTATANSIYLEWTASVDDGTVDHYLVQVNSDDVIKVNDLNYELQNLNPKTDYYVRVAAVDNEGAIGISETVKITTLQDLTQGSNTERPSFWWWWIFVIVLSGMIGLGVTSSVIIARMRRNVEIE